LVGDPGGRSIAVVGGLCTKWRRELSSTAGIRCYGSKNHTGRGELARLRAALRAGTITEVWILYRWIGHSEANAIKKICKKLGVPVGYVRSLSEIRERLAK